MPIIKVGTKHQVVIPNKIFNDLDISVGDFLEAQRDGNNIVLKPLKLIPKEDMWFYSKEWQKGEQQADTDIKKGKISKVYDDMDEMLEDLDK